MATAADLVRIAGTQVGVKESPAGSNRVKYGAWYGSNGQPWCAMFVSWVCHQAGYNLAIESSKGFAWTVAGENYFKRNKKWYTSPKVGDLVFFNFDADSGPEHVGLVVKVNADGSIETIEGNTSAGNNANGGEVQRRHRSGRIILGYGRLSLTAKSVPAPRPTTSGDGYKHPVLKVGAKGAEVKHLQSLLLQRGINTVVDGVFGATTEANVKKFQAYRRLTKDGVVGSMTWAALHKGA